MTLKGTIKQGDGQITDKCCYNSVRRNPFTILVAYHSKHPRLESQFNV